MQCQVFCASVYTNTWIVIVFHTTSTAHFENFALMGKSEFDKLAIREQTGRGPIQDFLAGQAERHGVWLVGGTIPISCDVPEKVCAS